jgi:SH3-domain binding protein 5
VQEELEKLNSCTDEINRLEVQLDEANLVFRRLLSDSTHHLKALHTRLGSCIEKARPYYEALEQMMRAQAECQQAAVQFQRAAGQLAKRTVPVAYQRHRASMAHVNVFSFKNQQFSTQCKYRYRYS